jgi:hypothetical protein
LRHWIDKATDTMTNHSYAQAWQDYRRRIRNFFIAWQGGFVAVAALAVVVNALGAPEWTFMALAAAWMAAFLWTAVRLQQFPCPRCGEPFFRKPFSYWPFSRECRHCSLPKWQT